MTHDEQLEMLGELMVDIDNGHSLLRDTQGDLSGAISLYCLSVINASEVVLARGDEYARGMAEGFARVTMGLTGLVAAYEDSE